MHRRLTVQLAQHPLQVVAPVPVQEHAPQDPVRRQRIDQVGDHPRQRRRVQVHRQGKPHLVGLGAVGQGRQHEDPGPCLVASAQARAAITSTWNVSVP